jgi:hypothetical protein
MRSPVPARLAGFCENSTLPRNTEDSCFTQQFELGNATLCNPHPAPLTSNRYKPSGLWHHTSRMSLDLKGGRVGAGFFVQDVLQALLVHIGTVLCAGKHPSHLLTDNHDSAKQQKSEPQGLHV